MELYRKTKWLRFVVYERKPKTLVLHVINTKDMYLGEISWRSQWRQYVYHSTEYAIYNNGCLDDISQVLTDLNKEHREKSK